MYLKNDLITVIIPIYKVEQYLSRCLDSIITQTYKNLDILLIDDGSPDRCPLMCDIYKNKDVRIRVIHQENKGLSESRNIGVKSAIGDFIVFIDSDDYVHSSMIEILYKNLINTNSDLSCCAHCDIYPNGYIENEVSKKCVKTYTTQEALAIFLFTYEIDVVSWNKLYKKKLFEGVTFPKGLLYEDHYAMYKIIDNAKKITYDSTPLYFYCKRSTSIGGVVFSPTLFQLSNALDLEEGYIVRKYPELKKIISLAKLTWLLTIYNKMILSKVTNKSFTLKLDILTRKLLLFIISTNLVSFKRKVQLLLFYFNKYLYHKIYLMFVKKYRGYI